MYLFIELSVDNLKILRDLGFNLSNAAICTLNGMYDCWGKHIGITHNKVFIQSGDMHSYQLIPISKASEVLTLYGIGMTPQEIFKTLRQDQHVVLTTDLN